MPIKLLNFLGLITFIIFNGVAEVACNKHQISANG